MLNKKILHITPHLGGGVGGVLLNWLSSDTINSHTLITLDFSNERAKIFCKNKNIPLFSQAEYKETLEHIKKADIVLIHFWNHPLLYNFLIKNTLPSCRCIIYSHVSGLSLPNIITEKILNYPDKFVYTTKISQEIKINDVILSTAGIDSFKNLSLTPHQGFTVGYIGTVDYAKMHPNYLTTLAQTSADKFLIVGGNNEVEIAKQADARFTFIGKMQDVRPYLMQMDIFAYLLNPNHFGTAEQALQEAMTAGIVPIVLNNKCEMTLVEHMKTGLVAKDLKEYVQYVEMLKNNLYIYKQLAQAAKKYAKEHFSLKQMIYQWNTTFTELMAFSKKQKYWDIEQADISPLNIFYESLGDYSKLFTQASSKELKLLLQDPSWQSQSKGTPKQYYQFLGGKRLKELINYYE